MIILSERVRVISAPSSYAVNTRYGAKASTPSGTADILPFALTSFAC